MIKLINSLHLHFYLFRNNFSNYSSVNFLGTLIFSKECFLFLKSWHYPLKLNTALFSLWSQKLSKIGRFVCFCNDSRWKNWSFFIFFNMCNIRFYLKDCRKRKLIFLYFWKFIKIFTGGDIRYSEGASIRYRVQQTLKLWNL